MGIIKRKKVPLGVTYGFEVEGLFTTGVDDASVSGRSHSYKGGIYKTDGSVGINGIAQRLTLGFGPRPQFLASVAEYNSPIMHSLKDTVNLLRAFKTATDGVVREKGSEYKTYDYNHFADTSCGIHVHVNSVLGSKIYTLLGNWDFIKNLQDVALQGSVGGIFCDCCRARQQGSGSPYNGSTVGSSYAAHYNSAVQLKNQMLNPSGKYWFANFHRSGTVEFRFLPSCEHKVDNVRNLLGIIESWLTKTNLASRTLEIDENDPRGVLKKLGHRDLRHTVKSGNGVMVYQIHNSKPTQSQYHVSKSKRGRSVSGYISSGDDSVIVAATGGDEGYHHIVDREANFQRALHNELYGLPNVTLKVSEGLADTADYGRYDVVVESIGTIEAIINDLKK